jgi:hypothetical protein
MRSIGRKLYWTTQDRIYAMSGALPGLWGREALRRAKAPPAARVGAATAILDRGWGKPQQQIDANVNFFDQMSDEEQRIMLAALAALKDAEEDRPELPN